MAYDAITDAEIQVKKPVTRSLMTKIKENFEYFLGQLGVISSLDLLNSDFEISSDGLTPDNWDLFEYSGGTAELETTSPLNGTQSLKFIHPGGGSNGGGYADSDYKTCGFKAGFVLGWLLSVTAAAMKIEVIIRWFDKDKVTLGADATVYTSIFNPTSVMYLLAVCVPPSGAKFFKVRLIGGKDDVDVAGTVLFDMVSVQPLYASRSQATPQEIPIISEQTTASGNSDGVILRCLFNFHG